MLSPDTRAVAMDLLRAPVGYGLDLAILTTYTLDLEALLALPLAVLARADGSIEDLLDDPLLVLEALREAGNRIHVFVDETGIAAPRRQRELYATLESSVHAVRAKGVFHPKVWVARFVPKEASGDGLTALLRVAVMSRNLTYDRSWDVALASEAPVGRRRVATSRPLGELLIALPKLAVTSLPTDLTGQVNEIAEQARRTKFPAPEGFGSPIAFHTLGLASSGRWPPRIDAARNVVAVAPFVRKTALDKVVGLSEGDRVLISRSEELDGLSEEALSPWREVLALSDSAIGEANDEASYPSGLHAKLLGVEHGWDVTWFVGSANLTRAAFFGNNVEVMAEVTGRKSKVGISKFLDNIRDLCSPYHHQSVPDTKDEVARRAESKLDKALEALLAAKFKIVCAARGDCWEWRLQGEIQLSDEINAHVWPVSIAEESACPLVQPISLNMHVSQLTAFAAFRLSVDVSGVDDRRLALRLPIEGVPEERLAHVLRLLIDSTDRFLAFLRALLGGLDRLGELVTGDDSGPDSVWRLGFGGETLLEDIIRAASRDPTRLETVRELIADLLKTEEGRRVLPKDLHLIWQAVEKALASRTIS